MLFADECTKQQFVPRHMHIRWPLSKRFDKIYVVATLKHPPSHIMLGVMSSRGVVGLYFILLTTTVNGPMYVELFTE